MKCNYVKKWTVSEQSAIQKRLFFEKSAFLYFSKIIFAHFLPKTDFLLSDHFFWIADNS